VKIGIILAFFGLWVVFSGCAVPESNSSRTNETANKNTDSANSARTNVEELGLLVNMPYEAEEIVWKDDPQHKKVIAVLRFSPEDSKKLIGDAEKVKTPEKVTIPTQTWFPPELIAQGDVGGDDSVDGLAYAANPFFQPPYNDGRLVHVEGTDYFVLEVSAK
jgi:hypothetical protein